MKRLRHEDRPRQPHPPIRDYTRLPDDHPDLDEVFLSVDVSNTAPPGSEGTEATWVVRYSTG